MEWSSHGPGSTSEYLRDSLSSLRSSWFLSGGSESLSKAARSASVVSRTSEGCRGRTTRVVKGGAPPPAPAPAPAARKSAEAPESGRERTGAKAGWSSSRASEADALAAAIAAALAAAAAAIRGGTLLLLLLAEEGGERVTVEIVLDVERCDASRGFPLEQKSSHRRLATPSRFLSVMPSVRWPP